MQSPNLLALVTFKVYPPLMGGQKGVTLFYEYLRKHCTIIIAASHDNDGNRDASVKSILYPNKQLFLNLARLGKLRKIIRANNINVVIAEHSYPAWIALLLRKWTGVPFIIHSHNIEADRFKKAKKWWWKGYRLYEGWMHRQADFNFFISEEDMENAINNFHLQPVKCSVISYGVALKRTGTVGDKEMLRSKGGLGAVEKILFFNGTMDYTPNYDAVEILMDKIEPLLRSRLSDYKIVITGNRIPTTLKNKLANKKNFEYKGYVENIDDWYQSADLFLNPVLNDTGVKTKVIEALANHCTVISTESGASGIKKEWCGEKLVVVKDGDWSSFANQIIELCNAPATRTPQAFFDHYSWRHITGLAAQNIHAVATKNA